MVKESICSVFAVYYSGVWLSDRHKQTVMDFYCEPKQTSVVGYVAP